MPHEFTRLVTPPLADAILVVDDDADNREMLAEYLASAGFTVHTASNGATALELADAFCPRVILMDLAMAGLDGLETARRVRANASTRGATIVMMTARECATDRDAADRAGCDFFIQKPYALPTLAKLVDGLVHSSATRHQTAGRRPLNFNPQSP
jgi:CheY-like chemotaxis protein